MLLDNRSLHCFLGQEGEHPVSWAMMPGLLCKYRPVWYSQKCQNHIQKLIKQQQQQQTNISMTNKQQTNEQVRTFWFFGLSCPALQQLELLPEGQTKCPTHLFSQVDYFVVCYTGPFDSHILLDFCQDFFIIILSYYNQNGKD